MKAPFPYFGGKSLVASLVWQALGEVDCYVEPFFGSGAVLLNRPGWEPGCGLVETVNDKDGLVANFWRALQHDPEAVAFHADYPVFENDLHARHAWLVGRKDSLQTRLEGNPNYYDAKAAGWWCWGLACWIGSGFCSGKGPWRVRRVNGARRLVKGNAGHGVNRKLVHLGNAGRGVNRQLVHLGGAGRGVNRKRVHLGDAGRGDPGNGECGLLAWMQALADRLARVRGCCGDWTRVCGGRSGDALHHLTQFGICGIFLDPPYSGGIGRAEALYRVEDLQVSHDVRDWCIQHGDDPRLRIVLCGYDTEHKLPRGWRCMDGKTRPGMAQIGNGNGKANRHRERLWLSPHCLRLSRQKAVAA